MGTLLKTEQWQLKMFMTALADGHRFSTQVSLGLTLLQSVVLSNIIGIRP